MIDRFFTLALAAGLLALAVSTVIGTSSHASTATPRLVQFDPVTIYGKRTMYAGAPLPLGHFQR